MLPFLVIIVTLILLLGYWAIWIRALGWALYKAGFGEVPWSTRIGIFVCTTIAGALFNKPLSMAIGGDLPTVIVGIMLAVLSGAILFLLIIRLFLGGPIISKRAGKACMWYLALTVAISVPMFLLIVGVRTHVAAPFQMNGQAMIPTLKHEEFVIVSKRGRFYQRGDIAVFEAPLAEKYYYVERIVGLPGETIIFDGTRVVIKNAENPQGFVLNESYVNCPQKGCSYANMSQTQFDIPEGSYFVMGDNRMNSTDSRFCFSTCSDPDATPFLPMQNMVGKVMGVFWPFEASKMITTPEYLAVPISSR